MTINVVTVTIAASVSPVDTATVAEGNFVFSPNGILWPGTPGSLPIVPQVQSGFMTAGTGSVQLVASDNFAVGVLTWDIIINIRGLPTVNAPAVPVNYATGSSQSVWDILSAYGYTFVTKP